MAVKRVGEAALIPVDFETISLANSTAIALSSTTQAGASMLVFSVETNDARFRADGTDPTLTTGVLLVKNNTYIMPFNGTGNLKFQRSTGTCIIHMQSFSYAGGGR